MKSANFMLDYACNQDCLFCLNEWRGNEFGAPLTLEQRKKALSRLKEEGVEFLTISGGEPLLDKEFPAIMDDAHEKGFKIMLQTNGILLTEELLEKMKGKISILEISLEGLEETHNALVKRKLFKKAVEKIKLAISQKFIVFTNFTITRLNYNTIEEYAQFVDSLGVKAANFTKLYLNGKANENREQLMLSNEEYESFLKKIAALQENTSLILNVQSGFTEELLQKIGVLNYTQCGAGINEIALNPDGSIKPCPSWPTSYGNILHDSVDEAVKAANNARTCSNCSGCLVNDLIPFEEIKSIA